MTFSNPTLIHTLQPPPVEGDVETLVVMPDLEEVLDDFGPLPEESVLLGVAADGLPVLLNLFDPAPGASLILADAGMGKTDFLRTVARAAFRSHRPPIADFLVMTPHVDDWEGLVKQSNCNGILDSYDPKLGDVLFELAGHIQNPREDMSMLLMIDDLGRLGHLEREELEMLYWIFLNGPAARVWPLVTLNAIFVNDLPSWVSAFQTRIFGRVNDPRLGQSLARFPGANLGSLAGGTEFTMREKDNWLRFWIPDIDL